MAGAGPTALATVVGEFEALGGFAPPEVHDGFSRKNFRRSLHDYASRGPSELAHLRWIGDGKPVPSFAELLRQRRGPQRLGLSIVEPKQDSQAWEFTQPSAGLTFDAQGAGRIITFHFDPHSLSPWDPRDRGTEESCVVRFSIQECFVPRSILQEQQSHQGNPPAPPPFELFPFADLQKFVQTHGVVPFQVSLCAYTARTRYRYELDLVHNRLLKDPRSGRYSLEDRVERSSRLCHGLDRFVARGGLPLIPRRVLDLLFESRGLTVPDVAVVLQIGPELAQAALATLVARQFALMDNRTRTYQALPQVFLTRAEAERERRDEEEMRKRGPGPALKASVDEMLQEIEAQATCPLCGGEMPAGTRGLLCPTCQEEVDVAQAEPTPGPPG